MGNNLPLQDDTYNTIKLISGIGGGTYDDVVNVLLGKCGLVGADEDKIISYAKSVRFKIAAQKKARRTSQKKARGGK